MQTVERSAWELFEVGWSAAEGGIESYLNRVVERCGDWFEADGVTLFLQIEGSDTFLLAAQSGIDSALPWSASFQKGESIAGLVAARGEPQLVDRPHEHPARNLGTAIIAPLETPQSGCLGVLNLSRRLSTAPFVRQDVSRVVQLARHVAMAVANARLFACLNAAIEKHRALSAQTANIVQSLHAGVLALDSTGRVVEANKEALRLLRTRKRADGMRWADLCARIPAPAKPAVERCVSRAASGKRRKETVSSGMKHFTISASPVPGGGVTLVIEDISNEVESERELARVRRLAEIGQMTAAIAHEIRNPLTSIRGAAQVLQTETRLGAAQGWGKVIECEAIALNSLCDQFLDFAKPMSVQLRGTNLHAIIERLLTLSKSELESGGISLHFTADPKMPIIQADGDKIGQAIRNLLRNAADAMPDGGTLKIETQFVHGIARVLVSDTGVGIREEHRSKVFTPFFTTKPSGTGLGLCNTQRVAEAHGGRVFVSKSSPYGSEFILELRAKKA